MDKKKILVVEDEPHARESLVDRLEFEGYEVVTAEDGAIGLSKAKEEKPDLIILDVMLPKMDGFKICRLLKFDKKFRDIPIIMLTARTADADISVGKETRADFYMTKPYDVDELVTKITELS